MRATASGAFGTGTITYDGQGNASTALLQVANNITLNNPISLVGRNSGTPAIENISGNYALSGGITLQSGGTYFIQSDGGQLTISGGTSIISNASGTRNVNLQGNGSGLISGVITNGNATVSLTKLGSGTWTISNTANSYTGGTNVNAGLMEFTKVQTMPATGTVSVAGSAMLAINAGGTGEFTSATSGNGSIGGLLAGVGGQGGPVHWSAGAILGIDATNAPSGLTYSGNIANSTTGSLGLTELGSGTLTLAGSNTYTGGTDVAGGMLILNSAKSLEAGTSLIIGGASQQASSPAVFVEPAAAPVPEPGTLALLAVDAAAAVLCNARRRRQISKLRHSFTWPLASKPNRASDGCMLMALLAAWGLPGSAAAAVVMATEVGDSIIDARGMTLGSGAPYGTAVNGESFETNDIATYGGYEYTAYWVKDTSSGTTYHVAVARRQDNGTTFGAWQVCDLPGAQFINGLSGSTPSDAHNVVSLGIDQNNGTMFLAYDMHDDPLKLMQTSVGAAGSATWSDASASLFGSQTSSLGSTSLAGSSLTYPMFVQTPSGNEQLFIRQGASGGGSWFLFNYSSSSSTWDSGHQIDNGFVGTYQGNTQRNAYPNGFTYNSQGQLMESFVWRETASSSNHDINYVYSNDGGNTWLNNAGQTVSSITGSPALTFSLTSAGLAVASISQNSSLMNQQTQAVDNLGNLHTVNYSLDPSKSPTTNGQTWDPTDCTYFTYWRDSAGDWHRDKIPGGISTIYSTRPKLYFDGSDNAIAVYGTNNGPGGSVVIAEASAASNWTDWQIVATTSGTAGGYFSEVQADASQLASKGILSVIMQDNPTTAGAASAIHSLDFNLVLTPAGTNTFTASSGTWTSGGNWSLGTSPSGNVTALIGGGRTVALSQTVPSVGGDLAIGAGGGNGTLNVSAGSLNVLNTISVGRDSGGVGTFNQTGGTVSSSRFVIGDYYSTTSGGGASTATVSGGVLTVGELQIAVSDGTSSTGSALVVSGSARMIDTGDAIVGDCGNTGSLILNGGTLTIAGNLMQGLNGSSTTIVQFNGGTLDMSGNSMNANQLIMNSGRLQNVMGINSGAALNLSPTSVFTFAGSNTFSNAPQYHRRHGSGRQQQRPGRRRR